MTALTPLPSVPLSNLLTHSRLKTAKACARQHLYRYELGYRAVIDREELAFGTLIHRALEQWWLAVQLGLPPERWLANALAVLQSEADLFARAKAEALVEAYHVIWKGDAELYEVLGVEETFSFQLVNPDTGGRSTVWDVAGKLDVRVRRKSDGAYGFIEHKTSSEDISPGSGYWVRLRLDAQVSIYFDGADSLGPKPAFCLYDVIGKPAQRPLKATPEEQRKYTKQGTLYAQQRAEDETPDEYKARVMEAIAENPAKYLQRGDVVRLEAELDESRHDIWQLGAELRERRRNNRWPKSAPEPCRYCPYVGVCSGQVSLDDPTRFERSAVVHPELESEEKESSAPAAQEAT